MSQLTTKIRKVVGKGPRGYGRGQTWLYVGDNNNRGYENQQVTIQKMIENFDCWKMTRDVVGVNHPMVSYHFFISNKKGDEVGVCCINEHNVKNTQSLCLIDYHYEDFDKIQQFNRNYRDVVTYEKIN